jgi:hypothetical protein
MRNALPSLDGRIFLISRDQVGRAAIFEIEFDRFIQHPQSFFLRFAKAGHVKIEALGDVIRFLAIEGVVDLSHVGKIGLEAVGASSQSGDGRSGDRNVPTPYGIRRPAAG